MIIVIIVLEYVYIYPKRIPLPSWGVGRAVFNSTFIEFLVIRLF